MKGLIAIMLVMHACPAPLPPKPVDGTVVVSSDFGVPGLARCARDAGLPTSEDVCDGRTTAEGLACVRCKNMHACLDSVDVVYCVAGTDCSDPRCRLDVGAAPKMNRR